MEIFEEGILKIGDNCVKIRPLMDGNTINNKSDSTTVGNGNEAIIGFAVILVVIIALIGYALYSKNNANQKEE